MDKTSFPGLTPEAGVEAAISCLTSGVKRNVFILIPFIEESQTQGRSSALIAPLPIPHIRVNTMI